MKSVCIRLFEVVILSALVILTTCGKDSPTKPKPPEPPPPPVSPVATRIEITPSTAMLNAVGQTIQLTARVFDQNNNAMSGATVTWSSSNISVATVSQQGLVTAVKNGVARITATSGSATRSIDVRVMQSAGSIVIAPPMATLMSLGTTVQLEATVLDRNGQPVSDASVNWSSGNEGVATVDGSGLVTAAGPGTTEITARSGVVEGTMTVSVMQRVHAVVLMPSEAVMFPGDTLRVTAVANDAGGALVAGAVFTWQSSDPAVAEVDASGLVAAHQGGTISVTATSDGVTGRSSITVEEHMAAMVSVTPDRANLSSVGETVQLAAVVRDQRGIALPAAPVIWTSGNEGVATVDGSGLVTAAGPGTAEITARSGAVEGTMTVTVMQRVHAVVLMPSEAVMFPGDTLRITAVANDAGGAVVAGALFTWQSSDPAVAEVDASGLVAAHQGGTISVTATSDGVGGKSEVNVIDNRDRDPLAVFYYATGGPNWKNNTNWLTNEPLNTWYGVGTHGTGRVRSLSLNNNNLSGSIPPELAQVAELRGLALDGNRLNGPIPAALAQLTKLTHLYLQDNGLTGSIPPELGQLVELIHLCLDRNRLTGSIPRELGKLVRLKWLHLYYNLHLGGPLPEEITELDLEALLLHGTLLCVPDSGEIQSWLDNVQDVRVAPCDKEFTDRDVLFALYNATNGTNWKNNANWLSGEPLSNWYGVTTDIDGRVTELSLSENNLAGQLTPDLGFLDQLQILKLYRNSLSGSLPRELGRLINLQEMHLYRNELTGAIPQELGQLSDLRMLDLANNFLNGSIPSVLGQLENLTFLDLAYNRLTGFVIAELADLATLSSLRLSGNQLTGSIPPALGQMADLASLDLSLNALTGTIPAELGNLGNLASLQLNNNALTGTIPAELGQLEQLRELNLRLNALNGAIPPDLGNLVNVQGLLLDHNRLNGTIISELGNLVFLRVLWLHENPDLSGSLPLEIAHFSSLESLLLKGTEICIPPTPEFQSLLNSLRRKDQEILYCEAPVMTTEKDALIALFNATGGPNWNRNGNWTSNQSLDSWDGVTTGAGGSVIGLNLDDNNLRGEIPGDLSHVANLRVLSLTDNPYLTGGLPREITALNLETLFLQGTRLCAPHDTEVQAWLQSIASVQLPDCTLSTDRETLVAFYNATSGYNWSIADNWLSDLPLMEWYGVLTDTTGRVRFLHLSGNNLVGKIPPDLGQLERLDFLDLTNNRLTEEIPSELGQLSNLRTLSLRENMLSGEIPEELGGLTDLVTIDLFQNELGGEIPHELGSLSNLYRISFGKNKLIGGIPFSFGNLENLAELSLHENQLSGALPVQLGNLSKLIRLDLSENTDLEGPLPRELLQLELNFLRLDGTSLCVPLDSEFQEWSQKITTLWSTNCRITSSITMGLVAYLTQATQSLAEPVPLVAGDPALLRVFITTEEDVTNMPPVRATFYIGDSVVHESEIQPGGSRIPAIIDEGLLELSANAIVPGSVVMPGLELVVEVDPGHTQHLDPAISARIPETGRMTLDVRELPLLHLTMVPLLWTEDPDYSVVTGTEGLTEDDDLFRYTRDLLPVHEFELKIHDPVEVAIDPVFRRNNSQLLNEVEIIRLMEGSGGHYMGVLREPGGSARNSSLISISGLEGDTIAHELGHNMSLNHAPCFSGFNRITGVDLRYPYEDGSIGTWGYDILNNRLMPPVTPDLMSYCIPKWISDYHFVKALSYRLSDEERYLAGADATSTRKLLVWGGLNEQGELYLEPAFAVNATASIPDAMGPYLLSGTDSAGNHLFNLSFEMPKIEDGNGNGNFVFSIPVQPDWSASLDNITLTGPEGVVTMDRTGSRSATILTDRASGNVRGVLRDWPRTGMNQQGARRLLPEPGLEILISNGIPESNAWDR